MKSLGKGLAGSVLVFLLFSQMGMATKAAKAASSQPCSLTFLDRVTDKITSDSGGAYKDGALPGGDSTVSCQVGGGSSDSIKLVLSAPRRGLPRSFWGAYTDPITGGSPTGTFTDGSYIIIEHVAQLSVGTSQVADAHFRFHGSWFFNWCGQLEGACLNYPGSDAVWVTVSYSNPTSQTGRSWDVSTDPPGGDVAQFQDGATNSYFYHMPFKLAIDCPGCQ